MSDYDIRAAVRESLAMGYSADPNLVADKVLSEVPPDELRDALASILPTFVGTQLSLYRARIMRPDEDTAEPASRKWTAAATLLAPVRAIDGWQYLKDCTREDVLALVTERRNRAAAMTAMADKYEHLADLMAKRKARVVADLSQRDLKAVFG